MWIYLPPTSLERTAMGRRSSLVLGGSAVSTVSPSLVLGHLGLWLKAHETDTDFPDLITEKCPVRSKTPETSLSR